MSMTKLSNFKVLSQTVMNKLTMRVAWAMSRFPNPANCY